MSKILISGGAGFLGFHLAKHLLATDPDARLTLIDDLSRGEMDDELRELCGCSRVKFLNADLCDQKTYRALKFDSSLDKDFDCVYHLAAVNGTANFYRIPHVVLRTNVLSTMLLQDWMKEANQAGKLMFTSSNEAYAGGLNAFGRLPIPTPEKVPLVIEDPYNPRWSYACSKLVGECMVIHHCRHYDIDAVIVRPHNLYGSRAGMGHVVPEFCRRIIERQDPFVINGGSDTRTFCHVDDCVAAMTLLMRTETEGVPTYQIGDDGEICIHELAYVLFALAGWRPKALDVRESPWGSVRRRLADCTKLRSLGWEPKVKLADGLRQTFEWYKAKAEKERSLTK